jgi:hypothetical protein
LVNKGFVQFVDDWWDKNELKKNCLAEEKVFYVFIVEGGGCYDTAYDANDHCNCIGAFLPGICEA